MKMKNQKAGINPRRNNLIKSSVVPGALAVFSFILINTGCQKNDMIPDTTFSDQPINLERLMNSDFSQTNLVSDAAEYDPAFIDPSLVNAWGIAFSDEGEAWVSSADQGKTTIYNSEGGTIEGPIGIPFMKDPFGGAPTGAIYNTTTQFLIPATGEPSEMIFATENGTIVAVAGGIAYTVANRSAEGAVYKGLTMGKNASGNYLFATDFHNGKVDVFNSNFAYQEGDGFMDPTLPAGFAPFNIRMFDGRIYVTYAKQLAPENVDDEAGPGNGYVDIFNADGTFAKRFASAGTLNSPWGIEQAIGPSEAILIGNFGDGKINVYDADGNFKSYLKSGGIPIEIEGLWAIMLPRENLTGDAHTRLYFTAGPDDETHGVFGYLAPVD